METMTMTEKREAFGVRASAEEVERVLEYVRAHKNRELDPKTHHSHSRPLKEIAEELKMRAEDVGAALRCLGFDQAAGDAERAHRPQEQQTAQLRKFRPWGAEE